MAYYQQQRPQYLSLMDMIDGGGAGRSGDTFQGGGILSALGNTMMRPAGYEERLRDRKNSTGRAIATAVQELTGGGMGSSPRPQMRPYSPENLPAEVPMGQFAENAPGTYDSMVPPSFDPDQSDFQNFIEDLRAKEQQYGLPHMTIDDAQIMFEEYKQRRIAQEMGVGGGAYGTMTSPTLPAQALAMPMPGY